MASSIKSYNWQLILKIKELDNLRVKSTSSCGSQGIDKNSFVLFYDDDVNDSLGNNTGSIWKTKFGGGSRVFLSSELKNINSFTICIFDQFGNQLTPVDNTVPSTNTPVDDITNSINMSPNDGKGIIFWPNIVYYIAGTPQYPYSNSTSLFLTSPYTMLTSGNYYFDNQHQQTITLSNIPTYYTGSTNFKTSYIGSINNQTALNSYIQLYNNTKPNIKTMTQYYESNYNMQIGFTFGVVENELNTLTKYSR